MLTAHKVSRVCTKDDIQEKGCGGDVVIATLRVAILERNLWNLDMVALREMGGLRGGTILSGHASCSAL